MNLASLKALAQRTLDETCQRFIRTHGETPDVTFYLARPEQDELTCVSGFAPSIPPENMAGMVALAIRQAILSGGDMIQAVLTAGEARTTSGLKALLVTLDSPNYTFLLYRYYEWRASDVVLLDTVDSTITGQAEFLHRDDAAVHFFDGLRVEAATAAYREVTQ